MIRLLKLLLLLPAVALCKDTLQQAPFFTHRHIDPDANAVLLGFEGDKWNNKAGGTYEIKLMSNNQINIWATPGGFVNIHNIHSNQFMSWQLWRGNFGVSGFLEVHDVKWLLPSSRLIWELAWNHESQHATDIKSYVYKYTYMHPLTFDNGAVRSFEYFKIKANYLWHLSDDKLLLCLGGGYKYFPPPLLRTQRVLLNAAILEISMERKLFKNFFAYNKFYYETIRNDFVAQEMDYQGNWDKEPFRYRIVEAGIGHISNKHKITHLYLNYSHSNGRGLDFVEVFKSFGFGARFIL